MDFQVNDQTYFLNIGEDGSGWEVMVATPDGPRPVRVYRDTAEDERSVLFVPGDRDRLPN